MLSVTKITLKSSNPHLEVTLIGYRQAVIPLDEHRICTTEDLVIFYATGDGSPVEADLTTEVTLAEDGDDIHDGTDVHHRLLRPNQVYSHSIRDIAADL